MTKKGLFLLLPILTMAAPILPVAAQDASSAETETDSEKSKTRYIATRTDLGEVLRFNGLDYKTETLEEKEVFVVDVDGVTTIIKFYGKEPDIDSILVYAGFEGTASSTAQRMNEWNSTHRFTRAYIDVEGDPVLEMDVNLAFGGTSERQLEDALGLWEASVMEFRKFVYETPKDDEGKKSFLRSLRD